MAPFRSLGMLVGQAQRAIAGGTRIFEVLDSEPELVERPDARPLPPGDGHLRLEDVTFAYGPDEAPVLHDIDLDVPAGRTIALIGPTASGKTTLTQLVPRFTDPTEGRVLLDGADVRDLRLDELRRAVGMVSQDPFLFSTTVRENIAYGRPDASDEEIRRAARMARADGFIEALPDGYDTVVGERGYRLSGGEKQRLAIARLLLKNPAIMILDEATSHLDNDNESHVQASIEVALAGRTAIVIAHRLSTVRSADRIAVLDDGRIAELGTHDELVAADGLYAAQLRAGELLTTA
jgi:ABC-type multidrug transport system fused ATPase/permease subunit